MSQNMNVFNRRAVSQHRDRAAQMLDKGLNDRDFLLAEVGERLADRLDDIKRRFPLGLDLGCRDGVLGRLLRGRGGIKTLFQCDLSPKMVAQAHRNGGLPTIAGDEEFLPFGEQAFDLVLSNLSLHWVNDLPGALLQVRRALKPDGLFLAAMLGGDTLKELRQSLAEAEIAVEGGLSPRLSPLAEVRDGGDLLQRAGFSLPVADTDTLTVSYADPWKLMADLRAMGETNAVNERRRGFTRRATLMTTVERYRQNFAGADGRIPATFQVIYLAGWAPHASQPQPLKPGSARTSLADVLGNAPDTVGKADGKPNED